MAMNDESTKLAAEGLRKLIAAACGLELNAVKITLEVDENGRSVMSVTLPVGEDDAS